MSFSSIPDIITDIRAGRMVVIVDDEDRENEGDLIMAAEHATSEAIAFMIRHTSGILCVPMEEARLASLGLPQMVPNNEDPHRTAFTVSVDYRFGTSTGVSSEDRAATIRALASSAAVAQDFARPGHIFPLRAQPGGVGGPDALEDHQNDDLRYRPAHSEGRCPELPAWPRPGA